MLCDTVGKWYNRNTTLTIIYTIIISVLLGVTGPIVPFGVNFPSGLETLAAGKNLIISQLPQKNLSEINPTQSLGNVTAPLDNIWKALGQRFNINGFDDIKRLLNGNSDSASPEASKLSLGGSLGINGTSMTLGGIFGIVKSAFILAANILVIVLEFVLKALKFLLGLVT